MELDPGVIVAAAAAVLFYFRLIRAQRKLLRRRSDEVPRLIRQWGLFWLGIALVVAAAFAAGGSLEGVVPGIRTWWWTPVAAGFGLLALSV